MVNSHLVEGRNDTCKAQFQQICYQCQHCPEVLPGEVGTATPRNHAFGTGSATKSRIWHRQRHAALETTRSRSEARQCSRAPCSATPRNAKPLYAAARISTKFPRNARQTFVRSRTHFYGVPTQRKATPRRSRNARPLYAALTHRQKAPALPVRDMTLAHFEVFLSVLC